MGFLSKIGKAFKRVASPLAGLASFIPGPIGMAAGAVSAGLDMVGGAGKKAGNFIGNNAGGFANIAGGIGGAAYNQNYQDAAAEKYQRQVEMGVNSVNAARDSSLGDLRAGYDGARSALTPLQSLYDGERAAADTAYGGVERTGGSALERLNALMGLGGDTAGAMAELKQRPSYQFLQDEARRVNENKAALTGSYYTPDADIAVQRDAQGIASRTYDTELQRLNDLVTGGINASNARFQVRGNANSGLSRLDEVLAGQSADFGRGSADIRQNAALNELAARSNIGGGLSQAKIAGGDGYREVLNENIADGSLSRFGEALGGAMKGWGASNKNSKVPMRRATGGGRPMMPARRR